MKSEKRDAEELRNVWDKMGRSLGEPTMGADSPEALSRKRTALDRLRDRYRVFRNVSLLMVFSSFMLFTRSDLLAKPYDLYLGAAFSAYFLICFLMDLWLWWGISNIDPLTMSVRQVVEKAMFYRKRHLQFIAVLLPLALSLVGFMGYLFSADRYMLVGMIIGAVCGAAIGVIQLKRFMREYRRLSE